jgi:hypothetical protein
MNSLVYLYLLVNDLDVVSLLSYRGFETDTRSPSQESTNYAPSAFALLPK